MLLGEQTSSRDMSTNGAPQPSTSGWPRVRAETEKTRCLVLRGLRPTPPPKSGKSSCATNPERLPPASVNASCLRNPVTWCTNRLQGPWAVCCQNGGAPRRLTGQAEACGKVRRSTTPMQITATPFVHPVAHTGRISSEALARVGLPTALAPTRASQIRFETAVGATGCTKRQSLTCIGRDHRRVQPKPL